MRFNIGATAASVALLLPGTLPLQGRAATAATEAPPPQAVLSTMHQMNEMEMHLGELAEERAGRAKVRAYGKRMVDDHRFGDAKVRAVAERLGLELLPPAQLPAAPKLHEVQQKAQQLERTSGERFDRMYLQMMVQVHEMEVSMLGDALARLPEGPVRNLVSRLRPILRQHLELARRLQG